MSIPALLRRIDRKLDIQRGGQDAAKRLSPEVRKLFGLRLNQ